MSNVGRSLVATQSLRNEHGESLLMQLNEFRKTEQYTDVYLLCEDVRIAAHRNVLAAASPYFRAMFGGNFPESAQREVKIEEMDPVCLQLAIDFIYTGHLELTVDCVQLLLCTSAFLQLDHLRDQCVEYMCAHLDPDNCLGFKRFAEKENHFTLLEQASQYIITHFKEVVQSEEFLEMAYTELASILSNDDLYVHSDDAVLRGLTRWAEHRPTERLTHLPPLLRYIHPACVSADVARSLPILQKDAGSQQWLDDVLHCADSLEWRIFIMDKMGRTPDMLRLDMDFSTTTQLTTLPRPSFAVSLVGQKNILYAQGGTLGRSTRDSFYYNIYRDQWHELHPLLMERSHHRSLILNDYLYAIGGNSMQGATSSVECFNLVTNKASFVEDMLAKRSSMGTVAHENVVYVMGGETDHRALYSVERYDPRVGQWHDLPPMREVNSYCSSALIGTHIYCCEGLCSYMERFDLRMNRWEVINFLVESEFYEIFTIENNLYSVSGGRISRFDMEASQWRCMFKFRGPREWDTAVALPMANYSSK